VPAHVDDEDVERDIVLVEAFDELVELLVGVVPVARPPCAEGEARRERNAAGYADEVAESFAIVVAVAEEVEVLTIAGGALDDPRPGAFFALLEGEVGGVEERAGGVVDDGPAGAGDEAFADGLAVFEPSAPSRVRVVPCRFSGSLSPGRQVTGLPSTVSWRGCWL
jgi:hypothetical protein